MKRNGASFDFEEYQPHVTITYQGGDLDLSKVEPYRGKLVFGPEIFSEVVEDWEKTVTEDSAPPAPIVNVTVEAPRPRSEETVVLEHDEKGRVKKFVRREIEE
jgi:hypothetical protein